MFNASTTITETATRTLTAGITTNGNTAAGSRGSINFPATVSQNGATLSPISTTTPTNGGRISGNSLQTAPTTRSDSTVIARGAACW